MQQWQETAILLVMTCTTCLFILHAQPSGGNGLQKKQADSYINEERF